MQEQKKILSITDKAAQKAKEIMEQQDLEEDFGIRVYVQKGGCSGYSYGMQFDNQISDSDYMIQDKGVKLIVDEKSAELLEGSQVDYVDTLEASGFKVDNPNATQTCGCGESFQV